MADARTVRSAGTREAIMAAAERLYAEHGLVAVSNRQISEAAGQGNVAAVGYHFGTRADLVRAILRKHSAAIDAIRQRMLDETRGSREVRDWVACLVRPATEHLATLGVPSWHARFAVQVMTDPVLRAIATEEALTRQPLGEILQGLGESESVPRLPAQLEALLIEGSGLSIIPDLPLHIRWAGARKGG